MSTSLDSTYTTRKCANALFCGVFRTFPVKAASDLFQTGEQFQYQCELQVSLNSMWTDTTIEQLITQYKQHPALWDPSNKGYRNRFRRDSALKEIAKTLNVDTVDVERKIIVLKTQFRRAHAKALKMRANGLSELDIDNTVWHWYRSLTFLQKRYFSRMPVASPIIQLVRKCFCS